MRDMWYAGVLEDMEREELRGEAEAPGQLARLIREVSCGIRESISTSQPCTGHWRAGLRRTSLTSS
jgi:hypothetical protein